MLKIVDVSLYNAVTDWSLLKANVSAVLIKSSQGTVEDKTFRDKLVNAQAIGMRVGIWHFYHPDMEWKPQADKFLAIYNSLVKKPRWIGLDCEESSWKDNDGVMHTVLPPDVGKYSAWLAQWLAAVQAATGITPAIYTRATWWDQWVTPGQWGRYPLWVAHYGVVKPTLPNGWTCA